MLVYIYCGQCRARHLVEQSIIDPTNLGPFCTCGRIDWRYANGTPIPFRT